MIEVVEAEHGPTLQAAIDRSDALSAWMGTLLLESTEAVLELPAQVSVAYASLVLEHRAAVQLLVHVGANSTAMAAIRPTLEAFVLAVWARHLASDHDLKAFLQGRRDPPNADVVLRRIGRLVRPDDGLWEVLRKHYKVLNDYAHGGHRQISRWIRMSEIAPMYPDGQMIEMLHFVDLLGLLAAQMREVELGRPSEIVEAIALKIREAARR